MIRSSKFIAIVFAISTTSCGDDPEDVEPGRETGACIEAQCLGDLMCLSDVCVDPASNASSSAASDESTVSSAQGTGNTTSNSTDQTSTSTGMADTTTGPSPDDACDAACTNQMVCLGEDVGECEMICLDFVGAAEDAGCIPELIAQADCIAALTCEQLDDWLNQVAKVGVGYPCESEDTALNSCFLGR